MMDPQAISVLNRESSPLLRLPGELRNKIYGYIFEEPVIVNVALRSGKLDNRNSSRSLLFVCRQIKAEASALCMERVTLHLPPTLWMRNFLRKCNWQTMAAIRCIQIFPAVVLDLCNARTPGTLGNLILVPFTALERIEIWDKVQPGCWRQKGTICVLGRGTGSQCLEVVYLEPQEE